jgi:hypothetical protein
MEKVRELQEICAAARAKKGRMDAASRERASQLIERIWTDPEVDAREALGLLQDLQAEALAEGIARAWPNMPPTHRASFEQWVPAPSSEKATRRLALLAAGVIDSDGKAALNWLSRLIPEKRKSFGKELRQLLVPILFGEKRLKFDYLAYEGAPGNVVLKVYSALLQIAFHESVSVSPVIKSRLATTVLQYLSSAKAERDPIAVEFQEQIRREVKKWPAPLREEFGRNLRGFDVHLASSILGSQNLEDSLAPEAAEQGATKTVPPQATAGTDVSLRSRLERRIADSMQDLQLMRDLHNAIGGLLKERESMRAQVLEMTDKVAALEGLERALRNESDGLRGDLASAQVRISELTNKLDRLAQESDSEKKQLAHQIAANATGRVEEFKNRLGLSLSRLVADLPGRQAAVSDELGRVLLLKFHQFLDALAGEGVHTQGRRDK